MQFIKINIDRNILQFSQSPYISKDVQHKDNFLDDLIYVINSFYQLDILKVNVSDLSKLHNVEDFADLIEHHQKFQDIIKY